jgi:hypothetical protein
MDRGGTVALVTALIGVCWAMMILVILGGRLRRREERDQRGEVGEWALLEATAMAAPATGTVAEDRVVLLQGLQSSEPEVRAASVTALGRLGHRHEWAIDGLIEALADGYDSPVRVTAVLDDLAPRPGTRLLPLLRHPSDSVRFSAVRLLARYPSLALRHVPDATRDASSQIRAAALETLRATTSGEALRCALERLEDPHPLVRAHAVRTAGAVAGARCVALVVPALGDRSWWVRDAARETLTAAGPEVADAVLAALQDENVDMRGCAALVLQELGIEHEPVVEELARPVERILAVVEGGRREEPSRPRRVVPLVLPIAVLETA